MSRHPCRHIDRNSLCTKGNQNIGNYSYLFASEHDAPPPLEPDDDHVELFQAKYAIPALWFTLFAAPEAHTYVPDLEEEPDYESRFLIVSRDDALSRLHTTIPQFQAIFENAATYCDEWVASLQGATFKYLKADISEILDMSPEDQLTPALGFLAAPDEQNCVAFFGLTNIPDVLADGIIVDRLSSQVQLSTLQQLAGMSPAEFQGA